MVRTRNIKNIRQSVERTGLSLLTLFLCCSLTAAAQSAIHTSKESSQFSLRATHLLGFEKTKKNSSGILSVREDLLEFQQNGSIASQLKIASIRDVVLGEESKEVGGAPMTLAKAAAPYGGGRVVSLFAHKVYDTLSLKYVDDDGGVHGSIFQVKKGEAEAVKDSLEAQVAGTAPQRAQAATQSVPEVRDAKGTADTRWSIQVDQIDPDGLALANSVQLAIFENLVDELKRTKRFQQVFREGDHRVGEFQRLLVVKTTVEKYSPGSETRRAVTTVSGATKIRVRSQLLTSEGKVALERVVNGNVRFLGSNLRATHNLARNIAKTISESSLATFDAYGTAHD